MGFWNFLFQKEIPIFSEAHFSKNGKSYEVLKNYFVFKIMGFIGFLWKTNSLFRSTFGKKIYIYIYIYGNMVYLENILETQVIFENNVYFGKKLENIF